MFLRGFFTYFLIFLSTSSLSSDINIVFNSPINKTGPINICSTDICKSLTQLINSSKESIEFAIYGLRGQDDILDALVDAQQRGVGVRGIIDKDIFNNNYYSDTHLLEAHFKNIKSDYIKDLNTLSILNDTKYEDKCSRPKGHKGPLQCFEGKGYASKNELTFQGDIMHNKFFIFDGEYIWTGSANISDTGTGGYNANIATIIKSKYIAENYLIEFEQMYSDGDFHRSKTKLKKTEIKTFIDKQQVDVFFSPQGYAMYRGVIPLIQSAKESIDIAIFFLTHKNASRELVTASNRGVKIRIIIDATGANNEYSKHNYLRENGIEVKVENWGGKMHMKSAIIDKSHIILGSMNWTSAGESKNDENTLIIRNSNDAEAYQDFFNMLWNSIPAKWLRIDPLPESPDSGYSCYDGIDNDFDEIIDLKDKDCLTVGSD